MSAVPVLHSAAPTLRGEASEQRARVLLLDSRFTPLSNDQLASLLFLA